MNNLSLYERVRQVPKEAQREITGGRLKGFTDINPMWRIKKLTEEFGECGEGWYTTIDKIWVDDGNDGEKTANIIISLYTITSDKQSMPIIGVGGSKLVVKEKSGLVTDDECWKKAYTDALSVACKALGIGADVYFAEDRTKYSTTATTEPTTTKTAVEATEMTLQTAREWRTSKGKPYGALNEEQLQYIIEHTKSAQSKKAAEMVLDDKLSNDDLTPIDFNEGDLPF